jgi:hypothetical protein
LFVFGAALVAFTAFREWLDNRPKPDPNGRPDPATYKVEVVTPKFNENVTAPIMFTGRVKKDPATDGLELWYVMAGGPKFWPGNRISIGPEKKWTFNYTPQNHKPGDRRVFRFCVVGKSGRALFRAYQDINKELTQSGNSYAPVPELTEDTYTCLEHSITLVK